MPKDYSLTAAPPNAQRRPKNAMDDDWTRAFLTRAPIGHVATLWDDQPFITPTNFWFDVERHEIAFHSNIVGRVRANSERHHRVCFEASEYGKFLPANVALEFSVQYAGAVVFGTIRVLDNDDDKRRVLYGLIGKYFPALAVSKDYRPITDEELKRTSVYAIAIESWSGKQNWPERAIQSDEWPPLRPELLG
ncbi:MAG: pyridoxamine 5'-phosphate oxidase family protein [Chloroflexi bacterium]|nr:pyridoxamine 5'-phosphate oxidase family protein [Chloroflexota bacterium]